MSTDRRLQKEATTTRILEAALHEFASSGYTKARLSDIASAAQVANGLPSQRFGSKEALFLAVVERLLRPYFVPYSEEQDFAYFMDMFVDNLLRNAQSNSDHFRMIESCFADKSVIPLINQTMRNLFLPSGLHVVLLKEQQSGRLPKGDLAFRVSNFVRDSYFLVKDSASVPDKQEFYTLLQEKPSMADKQALTDLFLGGYVSVYYVDTRDNSYTVYMRKGNLDQKYPAADMPDFFLAFSQYVETDVYEEDRSFLHAATERETLLKRLQSEGEFMLCYRDMSSGSPRHYDITFIPADENHFACTCKDVEALVQERSENEEKQAVLASFMSQYSHVFLANLKTGMVVPMRIDATDANVKQFEIGKEVLHNVLFEKLQSLVLSDDRDAFVRFTESIFSENRKDTDSVIFRTITGKGISFEYYEGFSKRIDSDSVMVGFACRNDEILEDLCNDLLLHEFTFIFTVDIASGRYTILRDYNPNFHNERFAKGDYSEIMDRMLAEVSPEGRPQLEAISTPQGLAEFAGAAPEREFTYRVERDVEPYVRLVTRIVSRRDGKPSMVFMGFTNMNNFNSEQLEAQRFKAESQSIISTLSQDFDYVGIYTPSTNLLRTVIIRNELEQILGEFDTNSEKSIFRAMYEKICAPEELESFIKRIRLVIDDCENNPDGHCMRDIDFPGIFNQKIRHCLLRFAKVPEMSDTLLVGIRSSEKEWKAQRTEEVLNVIASEYTATFLVDTVHDSFEICTLSKAASDRLSSVLKRLTKYTDAIIYFIDSFVHPEDRQRMTQTWRNIREELRERKSLHIYFRRRYGNEYLYCLLNCVKVGDTTDEPDRIVVSFAEKNREYLEQKRNVEQQRRNERILEILGSDYSCVYSGDLAANTFDVLMQTDRIDRLMLSYDGPDTLRERFLYFIDHAVYSADKESLRQAISATYLKERFAQYPSFTIVYRNDLERYCEIKCAKSTESETAFVIGLADKDAQFRDQKLQEQTLRSCMELLSDNSFSDNSLLSLLSYIGQYYNADRVYILDSDNDLPNDAIAKEWVASGKQRLPEIAKREMRIFMNALTLQGGYENHNTHSLQESLQREITSTLSKYAAGEISVHPLVIDDRISAMLCVDNPMSHADDAIILRTASSVAQYMLMQRKHTGEEHQILNKLVKNFVSVYQVDLLHDKLRAFFVPAESTLHAHYDGSFMQGILQYANNYIVSEDRSRFLREMSEDNILDHIKGDGTFSVSYMRHVTDAVRNYELTLLPIEDDPLQLILYCTDVTDVLLEQQIALLEEQHKLEQTVQERTAQLEDKNEALIRMNEDVVELLGNITEARDADSGEHIRRVKGYCYILAQEIMYLFPEYGLTESKVDLITSASALHDIGKISIPDSILLKPGRLTKEEFDIMKTHTTLGAKLLDKAPQDWSVEYLTISKEIALHHHEKWDGKGYPDGLKGDEIPLSAQIVSVADCFDALTTKRVYKDAYTPEKAYEMILRGECGQFSEKIMQAFKNCKAAFVRHTMDTSSQYLGNLPVGMIGSALTAKRVLLAEDNSLSRELATELLEEQGAIVTSVENGRDAVRAFDEQPNGTFDFILMDMVMPILDGIAASEIIRNNSKPYASTIPIFALTVSDDESRRTVTAKNIFTAVLPKPLNIERLLKLL